MATTLHTKLFKDISDEVGEARKLIAEGERRLGEAEALREILHDVLIVDNRNGHKKDVVVDVPQFREEDPPKEPPKKFTVESGAEFRRQVLIALEEQTPHCSTDLIERIDMPLGSFAPNRIGKVLRELETAGRAKFVGRRWRTKERKGRQSKYYVRVPVNGDAQREIIWP